MPSTMCILYSLILLALPGVTLAVSDSTVQIWKDSYDTVWQTVQDNHYDAAFGGVDWNGIRERYRGLVADVGDDDEFVETMNRMLHELRLSHYAVFFKEKTVRGGSAMFSDGRVGLDARLLSRKLVVTRVEPGSQAESAGIRPGFILEEIDGRPVDSIIAAAEANALPHHNERRILSTASDAVVNKFYGAAGTEVTIAYRDERDSLHETTLVRTARAGRSEVSGLMPPFYVEFESKRLPGEIGYVRFNCFIPPVDDNFLAAMDGMADVKGLIIDIRGNAGGSHEVGEAILSRLIEKPTLFSLFRHRAGIDSVVVQPVTPGFDGPVVVLIDVMNGSAAERFPGCIQDIGRASIVGERSPGSVGPSNLKELPNGASFFHLIAQSLTPDGTVLEGHGVIPDIVVALDRTALLNGRDDQLERAISLIEELNR